jgi:hypothetical protein
MSFQTVSSINYDFTALYRPCLTLANTLFCKTLSARVAENKPNWNDNKDKNRRRKSNKGGKSVNTNFQMTFIWNHQKTADR